MRQDVPTSINAYSKRTDIAILAAHAVKHAGAGRVLVLTAHVDPSDHRRAFELGAAGVVMKNQSAEILVRAIHKVHAGEVWLDRMNTATLLNGILGPGDPEDAKIQTITKREREIIGLVGHGLKNAAIGQRLFISETTVRNHLTSILSKLDVTDKFELVVYAFRHGLVAPDAHQPLEYKSRIARDGARGEKVASH